MSHPSPTTSGARQAIVLVHGAWFGAFCWDRVITAIGEVAGDTHHALAVELTGSGSRSGENGPHITLDDHITDVVSAIVDADLDDVVLVGHSYGGRVITGVVAQVAERIARVVYIDAHAPVRDDPGPSAERRSTAAAHGGMLPFSDVRLDAELVGGDDELTRITQLLVDHPFTTLTAPWRIDLPADLERVYVHALGDDAAPFRCYASVCADDPAWEYIELDGPHMLVYSHPVELARIITA